MPDQAVIKFDPNGDLHGGLQLWDPPAAEFIASGLPTQRGHEFFSSAEDAVSAGTWDSTAYAEVKGPYSVDEFMILLEGSLDIELEDGSTQTFKAGDGFVIPKAAVVAWKQSEYLRKFFFIHDNTDSPPAEAGLQAMLVDPSLALPKVARQDPTLYESEVPDMGMLTLYQDPTK